ncbi:solute carrier family 25 member 47-A-like isoform X1 [Myxocyprinus asiaticus]|uniref:solute carrier family 25 member 47-A-like isoform X1 n=1 Tax=Myxocyprinus asiaticus TaxID=70543 RepID=UPI002222948D|nr:solute carrier family 25 member 47-A-like isoform X1 [Myxocyprinus asiaticus]XP_051511608.1 solute carrier family 25 member 47-A-like isoform X1 [Myxocyprinus asiaticus]XP_051511609.1 solute carrier family 25 member 47-A-like isoform X1 [Myxocyprinus asiaticus]
MMHFADFLAGSIGGACGVAVGYPLDTVKVRIQTQKQFTGIWQCIVTTIKREGLHGFFKGMVLPVTTISMTSSVVFGTYRNCLQCFSQIHGTGAPNTKLDIFLAGLAGGVAQISVMSPGDIVKVRLQCQTECKRSGFNTPKPKYSGPIHCLLTIAKEEGILGLYKGALPLAFRDGPSFATYFLTYNTLCSKLTPPEQKEPGHVWQAFSRQAQMLGWLQINDTTLGELQFGRPSVPTTDFLFLSSPTPSSPSSDSVSSAEDAVERRDLDQTGSACVQHSGHIPGETALTYIIYIFSLGEMFMSKCTNAAGIVFPRTPSFPCFLPSIHYY